MTNQLDLLQEVLEGKTVEAVFNYSLVKEFFTKLADGSFVANTVHAAMEHPITSELQLALISGFASVTITNEDRNLTISDTKTGKVIAYHNEVEGVKVTDSKGTLVPSHPNPDTRIPAISAYQLNDITGVHTDHVAVAKIFISPFIKQAISSKAAEDIHALEIAASVVFTSLDSYAAKVIADYISTLIGRLTRNVSARALAFEYINAIDGTGVPKSKATNSFEQALRTVAPKLATELFQADK